MVQKQNLVLCGGEPATKFLVHAWHGLNNKISEWIKALKEETNIRYKIIFSVLKSRLSRQSENLKA